MRKILRQLPRKGDMPGVTQTDVINQSHPGYIGPMPQYNIKDELQIGYPPDMFSGPLLKGGKILSRFKDAISNLYKGKVPTSVLKKMPAGMLAKHGIRAAWRPSSVPRLTPEQLLRLRSWRSAYLNIDGALHWPGGPRAVMGGRYLGRPRGVFPKTKGAAQAEHVNPAWTLDDLGLPRTQSNNPLGGLLDRVVSPTGSRIGRQVHPGDMGSRGFDILDEAYTGGRMVRGGPSKSTVAPGGKTPKTTSNIPANPLTPMDNLNFQYKNAATEYGLDFKELKRIANKDIKRGHSPEDAYYWALENLMTELSPKILY